MNRWRSLSKCGIALYSESIWIYFGIAFFTKIEGDDFLFPEPLWWIIAGIVGYGINIWLRDRVANPYWLYGLNGMFLAGILIQNWQTMPEGAWFYGLAVSMALSYIYIRSVSLIKKEPTRTQMLLRFEGNILFYVIFILILLAHPFSSPIVHILFAVAIALSLWGMVLTLYPETNQDEQVETQIVGQAGWLPMLLGLVLVVVGLSSLLLLLPSVRTSLTTLATYVWEGVVWLWGALWTAIIQLLSLFPTSESEPVEPEPPAPELVMPEEVSTGQTELPLFWILAVVALIAIIGLLWLVSMGIRRWRPSASVSVRRSSIRTDSWWKKLLDGLKKLITFLILKIKMRFPGYYGLRIYWVYHLFTRWGRKNGIPREKHETPLQYVHKVVSKLDVEPQFTYKGQTYDLRHSLYNLGEAYSSAYYSHERHVPSGDFKYLLHYMKTRRLKKGRWLRGKRSFFK